MCKEIVRNPESCGKLTFLVSLKQPGSRDGTIQCFIKRDKSNLTYHLYLCLTPALDMVLKLKFKLLLKSGDSICSTLWKMAISNLIFLLNTIEATIEMDLDELHMSSSHSILMYIMVLKFVSSQSYSVTTLPVYKNIDGDQDSMDELDAALSELTSDPHYPQMMRHLVRSSWLLHVSCNKRRVAPIAALLSSVVHDFGCLDLFLEWIVVVMMILELESDTDMMWHLVRSSWLLHVSCNKRRVAPIAALLSSVLHD
ncbi:tubby-like F-box protein 8 [Tanacetum coccineum]